MGASMVQINTRVPAELKEQGDLALARAGYTPTQAVRALWEYAVVHIHEPQAIRNVLQEEKTEPEDPATQERLRKFEEGARIFEKMYAKLGIDPQCSDVAHLEYQELRDSYYEEKLEEE